MSHWPTAAPNPRNSQSTGHPTYWRDDAHGYEYQLITRWDWHPVIAQRSLTPGSAWTTFDLEPTAIGLVDWNDSHKTVAIAVDGQGRIHVAGNTRGALQPTRRIVSVNPSDITSWTADGPANITLAGGEDRGGYFSYDAWSDGTIAMFHQQRDNLLAGSGSSDWLMWTLGPGVGATWQPRVTGDPTLAEAIGNQEIAYVQQHFVDEYDRLHLVGTIATEAGDSLTRDCVFYAYSDDKGATFRSIGGTLLTVPFTRANTEDSAAEIFVGGNSITSIVTGNLTAHPVTQYPAFVSSQTLTGMVIIRWTGTEWELRKIAENVGETNTPTPWFVAGAFPQAQPTLSYVGTDLHLWGVKMTGGRPTRTTRSLWGANLAAIEASGYAAANSEWKIRAGAATIDTSAAEFKSESAWPQALTHFGGLKDGRRVTRIAIPNGDAPRVFEHGTKSRRNIGAPPPANNAPLVWDFDFQGDVQSLPSVFQGMDTYGATYGNGSPAYMVQTYRANCITFDNDGLHLLHKPTSSTKVVNGVTRKAWDSGGFTTRNVSTMPKFFTCEIVCIWPEQPMVGLWPAWWFTANNSASHYEIDQIEPVPALTGGSMPPAFQAVRHGTHAVPDQGGSVRYNHTSNPAYNPANPSAGGVAPYLWPKPRIWDTGDIGQLHAHRFTFGRDYTDPDNSAKWYMRWELDGVEMWHCTGAQLDAAQPGYTYTGKWESTTYWGLLCTGQIGSPDAVIGYPTPTVADGQVQTRTTIKTLRLWDVSEALPAEVPTPSWW